MPPHNKIESNSQNQMEFEGTISSEVNLPKVEFLGKNITPLIAGLGRIGGTKKDGVYEAKKGREWDDVGVIRNLFENGINFFDTAELYGWGYGEALLGTALMNKPRESYVLATKIYKAEDFNNIRDSISRKANEMRKRLGVEQIDVLYVHEPYEPLEEYISALDRLVSEGVIKSIGLSRFNLEQVKRAESILGKNKDRISILQVSFSLSEKRFLPEELIEHCKQNGITIAGYRPLLNVLNNETIATELDKISQKYNATPAQIAIAWVRNKNILPITRSHNVKHMQENIAALGISLDKEDIDALDNIAI